MLVYLVLLALSHLGKESSALLLRNTALKLRFSCSFTRDILAIARVICRLRRRFGIIPQRTAKPCISRPLGHITCR